jgi:hypothetical protein
LPYRVALASRMPCKLSHLVVSLPRNRRRACAPHHRAIVGEVGHALRHLHHARLGRLVPQVLSAPSFLVGAFRGCRDACKGTRIREINGKYPDTCLDVSKFPQNLRLAIRAACMQAAWLRPGLLCLPAYVAVYNSRSNSMIILVRYSARSTWILRTSYMCTRPSSISDRSPYTCHIGPRVGPPRVA